MRITRMLMAAAVATAPAILAAWFVASCSAGSGDDPKGGSGKGGGGGSSPVDLPDGATEDKACTGSHYEGKMPPLDVYILLDATGSMNGGDDTPDVWGPVTSALKTVIAQKEMKGIGVGLTFKPVPPPPGWIMPGACGGKNPPCPPDKGECEAIGGPGTGPMLGFACNKSCAVDTDCGLYGKCSPFLNAPFGPKRFCEGVMAPNTSCDPADYGIPVVPIGELPDNKDALTEAINKKKADGESTPSQPALSGTMRYAKQYAKDHPDHLVHILFATDGEPNNCTYNSIEGIAAVAEKGFNEIPTVPTFVLGLDVDKKTSLAKLGSIAAAGGTGDVYLADNVNVAGALVDMFNEIRANGVCQLLIPPPPPDQELDFDKVNVWYTPLAETEKVPVAYVGDLSKCDPVKGGWYYNDPTKKAPTKIVLCPATCQAVQLSEIGSEVQLGCRTITVIN